MGRFCRVGFARCGGIAYPAAMPLPIPLPFPKVFLFPLLLLAVMAAGCNGRSSNVGEEAARQGDEIVVAGRMFHTGAPVVLWTDPGGYDAYRTERRFAPYEEAGYRATTRATQDIDDPARYGVRFGKLSQENRLSDEELEQVRGGGWTLEMLRDKVDQFVLHYDVCGLSARCFDILHDRRGLSVHFMLDVDGTIYQTMDLKERAYHATKSNDRSVGIEIANIGAYSERENAPFEQWYGEDEQGTYLIFPEGVIDTYGPPRDMEPWPLRPATDGPVQGEIRDRMLTQYDLTPQQYQSLTKLTAALHAALPKIRLEYPTNEEGEVLKRTLTDEEWENFQGVIGHWHVQDNKVDPGPALDWERVVEGAQDLLGT